MTSYADASDAPVDVLVVGEALVDLVHGHAGMREYPGGSPANVALGLGRLGVDVALLTDLGRDDRGRRLGMHLEEASVRVLDASFSDAPTSTASAFIGADGSARYSFDVQWRVRSSLPPIRSRIVHTGSIAAFREPGAAAVRSLVRCTDAAEITFDPNIRPALVGDRDEVLDAFEAIASHASVVKLSDEDASWLYPDASASDVLAAVRELGPHLVAFTAGANGSLISVGGETMDIPAVSVQTVDTIGAGDAYMASLIASLLEHPSESLTPELARHIGYRAARAAAITVSRSGADLPTLAEVEGWSAPAAGTGAFSDRNPEHPRGFAPAPRTVHR